VFLAFNRFYSLSQVHHSLNSETIDIGGMPNNCTALEKDYGGYANYNILDMVERIMLLSGFSGELIEM